MKVFFYLIIISISFTFCKKRKREAAPCENPYSSTNDTLYLDSYTPYSSQINGITYVLQTDYWMTNASYFVWDTGDTATSIIVTNSGDYTVYAYDNTWNLKDSLTFNIGTLAENIQISNSFTPDGDGINDNFKPIVNDICQSSYSFRIYDQYHLLIFQSNLPDIGWDGHYKGRLSSLGLYIYQIEATAIDGKYIIKEGSVNLLQ